MAAIYVTRSGRGYVVRGDFDAWESRVIADALASQGMTREAAEWREVADQLDEEDGL